MMLNQQYTTAVLGIKPSSTEKEIKTAYFKLAKKYHPDLNPSEAAKSMFEKVQKYDYLILFTQLPLTRAYETLSDNVTKEAFDKQMGFYKHAHQDYDFQGKQHSQRQSYQEEYQDLKAHRKAKPHTHAQHEHQGPHNYKKAQEFWKNVDEEEKHNKGKEKFSKEVFDEFDEFFQFDDKHRTGKDDTKGIDYKAEVELEFIDAINGCRKEIELNKKVICQSCKGTKAKAGSQPRKCFECGGKGSVLNRFGSREKCSHCQGAGCIVRQPCPECDGKGVQRTVMKEYVDLPQGLHQNQKIKITGLGHASDIFQGHPGDLLLKVKVKKHDMFKREGQNIISKVQLSLSEAILGCQITVDTIDGKLNIDVKPGTNDGDEIVLKHYGVYPFQPPENQEPHYLRGDHIIRFKIVIPRTLTKQQRDILEAFMKSEKIHKSKFYDKVKMEFQQNEKTRQQKDEQEKQQNNQQNSKEGGEDGGGVFGKFKNIFK